MHIFRHLLWNSLIILGILVTVSVSQFPELTNFQSNPSGLQLISEVTLQKCAWATIPDDSIELPSQFLDEELSNPNQTVLFKLISGKPQCLESNWLELSEQIGIVNFTRHEMVGVRTDATSKYKEKEDRKVDIPKSRIRLNMEGVLVADLKDELTLYREVGDYCIEKTPAKLMISFCNNTSTERPRIPKCCALNEVIDMENSTEPEICRPSGEHRWTPKFHESQANSSSFLTGPELSNIKPHIFYSPLKCKYYAPFIHEDMFSKLIKFGQTLQDLQLRAFRILKNGSLIVKDADWTSLREGEYCVDGVQNYGEGESFSGNSFVDIVLYRCVEMNTNTTRIPSGEPERKNISKASKPMNDIGIVIYWVTIPVASLFLLLTIVVYITVWDIHNIRGYTFFSYVCSLFGFYLLLFISEIRVFKYGSTGCVVVGAGIHLLFLTTACWLTTINFDIWWTFRILKAGKASRSLKRYLYYAAFSTTVPVLIVFISVILNYKYKDDEASCPIIIPNYGNGVCALSNASVGYYLYTPVGILIGCNIIFFVWTICLLSRYQKSIGAALKGSTNRKEKQSLRVFLKLFVIMGISWITELIGWAAQNQSRTEAGLLWLFAVLDVINVLLAVPIFFIFVWNRDIYEQLWLRHPNLKPLLRLCIFGGCCRHPMHNPRPSLAHTMLTLGRKVSTSAATEFAAERRRRLSDNSETSFDGGKKLSVISNMLTLMEAVEETV